MFQHSIVKFVYGICSRPGDLHAIILPNSRTFPAFFHYFRLFNTVYSKQMFDKSLPMTGFKPRISVVGGGRSDQLSHNHCPIHLFDFHSPALLNILWRQHPGPTAQTTARTVRPTTRPPSDMIPNLSHAVKNPVTLTSLNDVVDDVVTVVGVVVVVVVFGKSVKKNSM